jgi:dipeptidase E
MPAPVPTIVAIGGGGLTTDAADQRLDDFILSLSGAERPRVCYLPTAGGDRDSSIVEFYRTLAGRGAAPSHLSLFRRDSTDLTAHLLAQDVVYVGGGNTANMLAIWRVHGLDRALRAAWEAGVVLAGMSAGSICWFESGTTDSFGPELQPVHGALGFLPGSNCPHFDSEPGRRPLYHRLVGSGELPAGYAADDGAALVFAGTELREVVSSRPGAAAYRVERQGDAAVETRLPVRELPAG